MNHSDRWDISSFNQIFVDVRIYESDRPIASDRVRVWWLWYCHWESKSKSDHFVSISPSVSGPLLADVMIYTVSHEICAFSCLSWLYDQFVADFCVFHSCSMWLFYGFSIASAVYIKSIVLMHQYHSCCCKILPFEKNTGTKFSYM